MQGFNLRLEVIRIGYADDDEVGGAVTTGTVVYENIRGRLEAEILKDELLMLNPGLETDRVFRLTMQPGRLDIRERDFMRITSPVNHIYFNEDLRVLKVNYSNFIPADPRDYMILTLSRSERAHTIQ